MGPMQQQHHQEVAEEKEQDGPNSYHDYRDDQDNDDNIGPRPAKRRQLSPLFNNPTEHACGLQNPQDYHCAPFQVASPVRSVLPHSFLRSPPNLDKSRAASVPARLERPDSLGCDNQPESRKSFSPSPTAISGMRRIVLLPSAVTASKQSAGVSIFSSISNSLIFFLIYCAEWPGEV